MADRASRSARNDANMSVRRMGTGGSRKPSAKVPGDGSNTRSLGKHEGSRDARSAVYEGDAVGDHFGSCEEHEYD